MAFITWDEKFSINIDEIDAQHKQLFNLINRLHEAIIMGEAQQVLIRALDKLVAYIYYQFDAEENFMRQNHYPGPLFLDHQLKHQAFVKKIAKKQLQCTIEPKKISTELLDFLIDWFTDHILNADKQMALILADIGQSVSETRACYFIKDTCCDALQKMESRFTAFADRLPAFIWLKDKFNRMIYYNKHWQQATGLTTSECSTEAWLNCIHQDDRDRLLAGYDKAFKELSTLQIEYRLIARDGTCLSILETAAPIMLENDEFAGFIGWGMNVSRQKQVEAALALSVEQLEETVRKRTQELERLNEKLNQTKEEQRVLSQKLAETQGHLIRSGKMASIGQLTSGIAHEINNSLDTIHANLNTLKHYSRNMDIIPEMAERLAGQLPNDNAEVMAFNNFKKQYNPVSLIEELYELTNASIETASRAQKLVQDLYDFSRIDKADRQPFNIEKNLDTILAIINGELKYKAEIIKDYGEVKPIHCIGSQLNQVFMNLLTNAVHAIEGFGKITIRTGYKDSGWLWVEIESTATGIPDSIRNKIPEPALTVQPPPLVLGLSLCRKIIEDHQGELTVDSIVGKRTCFRVYLPVN
jgi:two-component system NtrC family sensor kinase